MAETDIVQEINAEIRRVTGHWPESQFCVDLASRAMAEITRLRAALRFWIEAYRTHQHEPLVIAYESTLNRFPELGTSAALEGRNEE